MERRSKDGGGGKRQIGIGSVGVEVSMNVVKVGVVGIKVGVLEVVGVIGM